MKTCCRCKEDKDLEEFNKASSMKDGLMSCCKVCYQLSCKARYNANIEKSRQKARQHSKTYRDNNPGKLIKYRQDNVEKIQKANKSYRDLNPSKREAQIENWNKKNPNYHSNYGVRRRKSDFNFRILGALRTRLNSAIKSQNVTKQVKTIELIGCSIEELKSHLESLFTEGMSWENYGEWHVDHKRPCASFDLTKEEEQKLCFHYTNLQPLWALDNIKKNSFYEDRKHFHKLIKQ